MEPSRISRWLRLGKGVLLAFLASAVVGIVAWLMGQIAVRHSLPDSAGWGVLIPTPLPALPQPLSPFAHADPAIVAALEHSAAAYEMGPSPILGDVPPVGVYLPRASGSPALTLTLLPPTVAPWPTSPVLPTAQDAGILPTPTPYTSPLGGPPPAVYGGDNCAPRGLPVDGILTQRYHPWHIGIDQGIPVGTPVTATHSGRVIFAGWSTVGYGNLVILQNGPFITYYAHLSEFNVVVNEIVGAGSILAWSGNTGNSTGPHLHYEIRINDQPVDPLTFEHRGYGWC